MFIFTLFLKDCAWYTLVYYKQKIRKMQKREKRRRGKQSSHRAVQIGRFLLPQHGFIFQTWWNNKGTAFAHFQCRFLLFGLREDSLIIQTSYSRRETRSKGQTARACTGLSSGKKIWGQFVCLLFADLCIINIKTKIEQETISFCALKVVNKL